MAHDWTDNGTKPCADPGDGREGRDRETLTLAQEQLVKQAMAVNPRTVMVLVSSFPFTIDWSQAHVPAILQMAHSSQDEGWAHRAGPVRRLQSRRPHVVTWPASMDQLPPMMDYDIRHGRTYMYFKGKPLYPFGYGLSYTTSVSPIFAPVAESVPRRQDHCQRGCDQHRQAKRRRRSANLCPSSRIEGRTAGAEAGGLPPCTSRGWSDQDRGHGCSCRAAGLLGCKEGAIRCGA